MVEISQNPEALKNNDLGINALVESIIWQTYTGNKHLVSEIHSNFLKWGKLQVGFLDFGHISSMFSATIIAKSVFLILVTVLYNNNFCDKWGKIFTMLTCLVLCIQFFNLGI